MSAGQPTISREQAREIARRDAEKAYGDLSPFEIITALEEDGWHVDYELKDPDANGGGPHYTIDAQSGRVASKRYEQ